jgi:hypothetical protein
MVVTPLGMLSAQSAWAAGAASAATIAATTESDPGLRSIE